MTDRSISELPSLRQFRTFCLICIGISLVVLLIVSAITFVPSAQWLGTRAFWFVSLIALYFSLIAFRTHVMIRQLTRTRPQTFDRAAPEWITIAFLLAAIAVVLWPHHQ
jgi:uncharacterized membrane protein SirB2